MNNTDLESTFLKSYEMHADPIFRFCFFKLSDREAAQDAVQEVFSRYWVYLQKGNTIEHTQAFLFTTASNYVKDQYRKKKSIPLSVFDSPDDDRQFDVADETQGSMEATEYRLALRMFASLPDDERLILQLRFVEDMQVKDIAKMLSERENTIAVRISRIMTSLREKIKQNEQR